MLEGPEVEAHHHHKTGHSKLDLIFASLAVVLSLVSVVVALHHGKTMERLVQANTWPNLSYSTGNEDDKGNPVIRLVLRNTGVGPARIDTFEVFYDDKPVREGVDLIEACCAKEHFSADSSPVRGEVLPARDQIEFLTLVKTPLNTPAWDKLNHERLKLRVRACYCSVFDECYVMDTAARRPEHVEQCVPSQGVEYREPTDAIK